MASIARTAYRGFMREVRSMRQRGETLPLVMPVPVLLWGQGSYVLPEDVDFTQSFVAPGVDWAGAGLKGVGVLTHADVARLVRHEFRRRWPAGSPLDQGDLESRAMHFLAMLNFARAAAPCYSATHTTPASGVSVTVTVQTRLVGHGTDWPSLPPAAPTPPPSTHQFAYCIRIANSGTVPVALRGRTWTFTDAAGGTVTVPRGSPGVVGQTPLLHAGDAFQYVSGAFVWAAARAAYSTPLQTGGGGGGGSTERASTWSVPPCPSWCVCAQPPRSFMPSCQSAGTYLRTREGTMEGSFQMVTQPAEDGDAGPREALEFDALAGPTKLKALKGYDLMLLLK